MEWRNLYRGMMMGVIEVVPGVSSGTFAVLLGIYDRLIGSINGLTTRDWKKSFAFLVPLVIGMGIGLFTFSHIMTWLLENHMQPTYYFFIGLIIGIIPFLFRESAAFKTFKLRHFLLMLLGIILISQMQTPMGEEAIIEERSLSIYIMLFLSGFIGSAIMLLPGISGSFVLIVLGVYYTIIEAVSELEFSVILVVGAGIVLGVLVMSKIIHYFFRRFRSETFALLIGLVIGSVYVIFPGWTTGVGQFILCAGLFVAGLGIAYVFGKIEY